MPTPANDDAVRAVLAGPKHAGRPLIWALWGVGGFFVLLAALAVAAGSIFAGIIGLAGAALFMAMARGLGLQLIAVQLVNTSIQRLTRGDHAAAEALLVAIPPAALKQRMIARAAATVRAVIALYEGRVEEAEKLATIAIEGRRGWSTGTFENGQIAMAHALRGLVFVALGNPERAKADADEAESSVDASPEVIARARVVRALLASRAAYHEEAFRKYVAGTAPLVLEYAAPRERVLFRALRRMAGQRQAQSAYRMPGRVKGDGEPSKVASWISFMAPDAAAYVEDDRAVEGADQGEMSIPSGVPSDLLALQKARAGARGGPKRKRPPNPLKVLGLWAVVLAMLLGIWQYMKAAGEGDGPVPAVPPIDEAPVSLLATVLEYVFSLGLPLVIGGVLITLVMAVARKRTRDLAVARRLVAIGDLTHAIPRLEVLITSSAPLIAATAELELARLAARRADFGETVVRCDRAIALVAQQPHRAAASDLVLPALMTESAVANAARGTDDEAQAELAMLCRDYPTYADLPGSLLRVRLVSAAHRGDRNGAYAAARSRTPDLALPYREEILADLVLASFNELTEADRERVQQEMRDDEQLRRWIEVVAPALVDERSAAARRRVAPEAPEAPADPDEGELREDAGESAEITAAQKRIEANG